MIPVYAWQNIFGGHNHHRSFLETGGFLFQLLTNPFKKTCSDFMVRLLYNVEK